MAAHDMEPSLNTRSDTVIEFNGKASEYFKIWIVNLLLSIITLGIYSAWAKVRTKRYFYNNTVIEGSSFDYTANPLQILKGRFIAVIVIIGYQSAGLISANIGFIAFMVLLALIPATIVLSMRFRMRNTVWRGIRFSFSSSFPSAYKVFLLPVLLVFVIVLSYAVLGVDFEAYTQAQQQKEALPPANASAALTFISVVTITMLAGLLLFPWWQKMYFSYIAKHSLFGRQAFSLKAPASEFYIIYIVAALLVLGATLLLGVLFSIASEVLPKAFILLLAPLFLLPYVISTAVIFTRRTNAVYSNLALGDVTFNCELDTGKVIGIYFTNTLAIICSLGLAIPWAVVRMAKYRAEAMTMRVSSLDEFAAKQVDDTKAFGEEIGEMFDLELGF